jgi:hypothetical protein
VSTAEEMKSVSYARILGSHSGGYEGFYQWTTRRNIPEVKILQKRIRLEYE